MVEGAQHRLRSLGSITVFLIVTSALSRVLGYVREIVITTNFGQNFQTDAYKSAFLIPDFLYLILVGGAFSTAFIPVLSRYITNKQEKEAWVVSSTILNLVLILLFIGIGGCFLFAPFIIGKLIAPGYNLETQELAVFLTRIMLIQSFFMCLSGISQGICHVYQRFAAPAIGSLLYNIFIILFGVWLMPYYGITGFAVGVVVGSFINFAVHIPTLWSVRMKYFPVIRLRHEGVKEFFRLVFPVLIGLSVIYLNMFVTMRLGSFLPKGANTLLNNANRLMQLPVGIFATAIASAFFPTLTQLIDRNEIAAFKRKMVQGINLVFFILTPAMVGLIVVREPLIRALFYQGAFTELNVKTTASALMFYSLGIVGYSQQQILNRGFYALRNTKAAVAVNCVIVGLNIVFSYLLVNHLGADGLAFAYSLAGILAMIMLYALLSHNLNGLHGKEVFMSLCKTGISSLVMYGAVTKYLDYSSQWFDLTSKIGQIEELLSAIIVGIAVYLIMVIVLRVEEIQIILGRFIRR